MSAKLALAVQASDTALALRKTDPAVPHDIVLREKQASLKVIAGIDVADKEGLNARLEAHKEGIRSEAKSYAILEAAERQRCKDAGVAIVGTMPAKWWDSLCTESGLFRAKPDEAGTVLVNFDSITKTLLDDAGNIIGQRKLIGQIVGGLTGSSIAAVSCYLYGAGLATAAYVAIPAGILGALGLSLAAELYNTSENFARVGVLKRVEKKLIKKALSGSASDRLKKVWPGQLEPKTGIRVGVALPPASADIQANLARAKDAGMDLQLAVAAEAVSFKRPIEDMIIEARAPVYDEVQKRADKIKADRAAQKAREQAARAWAKDPVAYYVSGPVAVIVAQYGGEFPAEMAVIERVTKDSGSII